MNSPIAALNALNFFLADVRDGLGPFLGVFLQGQGWSPGEIGLVMTVGGLAGMAATTPLGMLVDRSRRLRLLLAVAAIAIILACGANFVAPVLGVVASAQIVTGIAAAVVAAAVAGLTLGLVGQKGYPHQLGRNEAWNHAGNATAALLSGGLGWMFGLPAVFALMAAMAGGSRFALLRIPAEAIDHAAARGASEAEDRPTASLRDLLAHRPLCVLAATMLLFHLANAAMLPLLGQAMVARGTAGDASAYTAATVLVAQGTMIPLALFAAWLAERRGYWIVFVLALLALPLRGALAGTVQDPMVLIPVQMRDGAGAGMLGVAMPGLVARLLNGTGRVNTGLALVMTAQGIGAACSPLLAGLVAEWWSYGAAFLVLGVIAGAALALWLVAGDRPRA